MLAPITSNQTEIDEWYDDPSNNPYLRDRSGYGDNGVLGKFAATSFCWGVERLLGIAYALFGIGRFPVPPGSPRGSGWPLQDQRTWPDPVTDDNRATFMLFNSGSQDQNGYHPMCEKLHYNSPPSHFTDVQLKKCFDPSLETFFIIPGLVDRYRRDFWPDVSKLLCNCSLTLFSADKAAHIRESETQKRESERGRGRLAAWFPRPAREQSVRELARGRCTAVSRHQAVAGICARWSAKA